MGSINQNYKEGLEKYKGQILGFDKSGYAVYAEEFGLNALDTCECCGRIIHSQISNANFCPICSLFLGLTSDEFIREYCLEKYKNEMEELDYDIDLRRYNIGQSTGFIRGMHFSEKYARPTLKGIINFGNNKEIPNEN